jgi:PKD domain-containing protein/FG-GAP repeat protein
VQLRNAFLLAGCALWTAAVNTASAQSGSVLRHRKISEVSGSFPGGLDPNDQMGRAIACVGDIDGDGNVDLVSGAIGDDDGGVLGLDSDTGALWVHFLNANGSLRSNTKISMATGGWVADLDTRDQLGRALAPIGDFDGDGVPDLAAGACRDDDGGVNRGAIYLLCLRPDGTVREQFKISDTAGDFQGVLEDLDEFGRSIACLGDLDGNGVVDLAVGSTGDDDGGVDLKGAVWILFLNADGTVLHEQKISDTQGNFLGILGGGDIFGFALASLGDVDGDGVSDLAVGTPKDDDGGVRKGAVWILFMRTDGMVKGHKKISDVGGIYGLQPGDEFGSALAGLGDIDGDGVPDMAVGAILDDGLLNDQGAVWINLLNTDGSVKSKLRINDVSGGFTGKLADGDWFGAALATMPDIDGDGRPELAVGARFDDDGGINTGSLWVLFLKAVQNVPPTPAFVPVDALGTAPFQVAFDDRSSAGAVTWDWDFGDGSSSTQHEPTHVYDQPGLYTVTLTVGGPGGTATLEVPGAVSARLGARATPRNGTGRNRVCFTSTSLPILGTTWTAEIDATGHANAGLTAIVATSAPGYGVQLAGGELLVLLPAQGAVAHFTTLAASGGGVAHHSMPLPPSPSLVGVVSHAQGFVLGGRMELCNAIDLLLGY